MTMTRSLLSLLLALVAFASAAQAQSVSPDAARRLIEEKHRQIEVLMNERSDLNDEQVRAEVRKVLLSFVDFGLVAQRAFKRYFPGLRPEQKHRYVASFKALVEATYLKRLKPGKKYKLVFRGEPQVKGAKARVRTTFRTGKSEAEVDYLLAPGADGKLMAYDLVIDEVSMARNYRKEFYKIMKEQGFEALLKRIEDRTKEKETER